MKNRIISWPGTKFRQIDDILNIIKTDNYNIICEPYLGGAAFSLQQDPNKKFLWAEKNKDLYNWWYHLLFDRKELLQKMNYYRDLCKDAGDDKDTFIKMRAHYNILKKSIDSPSKNIYVIDACALLWVLVYQSTNNLARFNKKGEYNQTWGKGRKVPDVFSVFNNDVEQYLDVLSKNTSLYQNDDDLFDQILYGWNNKKEILVYLDPPYLLRTEVYDKTWDIKEEKKMFDYIDKLEDQGIAWFMTNYLSVGSGSDEKTHPFIETIKKWDTYPLKRKKDARPSSAGNKANEFIIFGSHYSV